MYFYRMFLPPQKTLIWTQDKTTKKLHHWALCCSELDDLTGIIVVHCHTLVFRLQILRCYKRPGPLTNVVWMIGIMVRLKHVDMIYIYIYDLIYIWSDLTGHTIFVFFFPPFFSCLISTQQLTVPQHVTANNAKDESHHQWSQLTASYQQLSTPFRVHKLTHACNWFLFFSRIQGILHQHVNLAMI